MLNKPRDLLFTVFWIRKGFMAVGLTVKNRVLSRYLQMDGAWVETGTYKGETTRFLAGFGGQVHTIEPEETLYAAVEAAHLARSAFWH